ncbi:transcriptional regulator [Brevibacillus laterosporus]|uniref:helix-turn-helix domain-containing protein n=1 Tax=Brevibacillus laterosporus TaxID=1465 RepID=UPI000CE52D7B|nr:helix-turn-helix transcriptional regulator [Brevibacillus laterosporus]PPA80757.1 transcriptional regulator [Brevibacillus laterosporus]
MSDKFNNLTYTTIGELIRHKRKEKGLKLSEVSRMAGVSKGIISRIETGEIKNPRMKSIKPIADVLGMPYEELIEYYIQLEHRNAILKDLLMEVAEFSNLPLIEKVAMRFLENSKKSTDELLRNLIEIAGTFENDEVRLTFYNTIIKYARSHGESQYIAKGLYEKYMIEREDLKNLEDSFKVGEEVLHYVDFLSQEEKISLYYRMSLHAHNIKKYDKCVQLGEVGHTEDTTINDLGERVALAVCNSYLRLDNFSKLEEHLEMYERLGYQFIIERTKIFRSIILSKTGQYKEAIPLLTECVKEAEEINRLPRINSLLEALLSANDLDSIRLILNQEEKNTLVKVFTPYKYSELGKYFKYKGAFLVKCGLFNEGIEAYVKGMDFYSNINDRSGIMECSEMIYNHLYEQSKEMNLGLLKKMKEVYNIVNNGDGRGDKNEKTSNHSHDSFAGIM